jgi:hypothetical protein
MFSHSLKLLTGPLLLLLPEHFFLLALGLILSLMLGLEFLYREALLLSNMLELGVLLLVLLLLLLELLALLLRHEVFEEILGLLQGLISVATFITLEDLQGLLVLQVGCN